MTYTEIIEKLKEKEIDPEGLTDFMDDYGDIDEKEFKDTFGEVNEVYGKGGGEGGGEHVEKVYHFIDHDVYIRVTGRYYSYDGTNWNDDFSQVFPKQKTITVYTTKND